jgi:hypothetical protein
MDDAVFDAALQRRRRRLVLGANARERSMGSNSMTGDLLLK